MKKSQLKSLIREAVSSRLNEAQDFMAQLKSSGKLVDPTGQGSSPRFSETYQLTGDTKYDSMRFFYKPTDKNKPYGLVYIQGHGLDSRVMASVGLGYQTQSGIAGVDGYIHDGNYNTSWVSEQDFMKAVTEFNSGFGKYAKSYNDFYKGRGLSPGVGDMMQEGAMADIDIIAQESATFEEFVSKIAANPRYKSLDANDAEVKEFLQMMYDDSQAMSETKRVKKLSIKEEIRKAIRAMLKEVDDTNDRVAYKDKNNPNFIYIDIKYTTGMGGALTALGSTTMSGSARKQGAERAMVIAKDTANELEKSYQLDDIDVQDLGNGKVQIFAVSDEFNNIDPKTDSKLKAIVDKFKHKL